MLFDLIINGRNMVYQDGLDITQIEVSTMYELFTTLRISDYNKKLLTL